VRRPSISRSLPINRSLNTGNSTLTDTSPSVSIHKRTLDSGIYTITNLSNFNWAVLSNDDDNSDVVAGCSADEDAGEKVSVYRNFFGSGT
jgi:hypothetical protein